MVQTDSIELRSHVQGSYCDTSDISKKLIELAKLEHCNGYPQLESDIENAVTMIKEYAESNNTYRFWRSMYNVLIMIAEDAPRF